MTDIQAQHRRLIAGKASPVDMRYPGSLTFAYTMAHFGKSLLWYASESLFAFLLTEVAHLQPMAVGWVLAASFLLSAGLDMVVGLGLRQRLSTAAGTGKLQLFGAITSAAALILLFSVPAMRLPFPFAFATSMVMLFRLAYAFIDIPQNAMLSSAVRREDARISLAAARLAASGLAALAVSVSVSAIVYSAAAARPTFLILSALVAGAVTITASWHLHRVTQRIPFALAEPVGHGTACAGGRWIPADAWLLIGVMFVSNFAAPLFTKLVPYYATFQLRDPVLGSSAISLISVGGVAGQPAWLYLLRGRSAPARIVATSLATAASAALFGAAGLTGSWFLLPVALLLGTSSGGLGTALWASYGQRIAQGPAGREGFAYGLFTASAKIALAVDAIGIGWLLSNTSFRDEQSREVLFSMTLPPVVAGLTISVLILISRCRRWFA